MLIPRNKYWPDNLHRWQIVAAFLVTTIVQKPIYAIDCTSPLIRFGQALKYHIGLLPKHTRWIDRQIDERDREVARRSLGVWIDKKSGRPLPIEVASLEFYR